MASMRPKTSLPALGLLSLLLLAYASQPVLGAWGDDLRLMFNPGLEREICGKIDHCQASLEVEIYELSNPKVMAALTRATQRGVAIRIILCPTQESNLKTAERLRAVGLDVRWYPVAKPGEKMHLKMAVFDSRVLVMGSPNWTRSGLSLNHEGLLVVSREHEVAQAQARFEADWNLAVSVCPLRAAEHEFGRW